MWLVEIAVKTHGSKIKIGVKKAAGEQLEGTGVVTTLFVVIGLYRKFSSEMCYSGNFCKKKDHFVKFDQNINFDQKRQSFGYYM